MYSIEVDTNKKILRLFKAGVFVKEYPIGIGKKTTPTPLGRWVVTQRVLMGPRYGGYFLQISEPSGLYGIHGTDKPWSIGQEGSRGCVRMYNKDIIELFGIIQIGAPVYIF